MSLKRRGPQLKLPLHAGPWTSRTQAAERRKEGLWDITELTMNFAFNPRDGIDNPALSLAEDSEPEGASQLRFCFLKKEEGESFGFWLRQEVGKSGHIVRQVTPGGLAHRRGLRDGDRILEVNGMYVEDMEHFQVVWKIKHSGKQISLTVLDGNTYDLAKALDRDLAQLLPCHNRPRLCHITKDRSGFGFSFSSPEGVEGTFRLSVTLDGPAHKAGVPDGSWLLELNGARVENWTSARLNKKLKNGSSPIGLLVIDAESEEFYRQHGIKVTAAMADASWVPFKVRKLPMVRGPAGYGFLLKEEKCASGKYGQFLREVDAGMPAEKAGMRDGDRLLAVNGDGVEELDHQEVVLKIRADAIQVTLLVIDAEGSKFYDLVGLSPLLFYNDEEPRSGLRVSHASSSSATLQEDCSPGSTPPLSHLNTEPRENALEPHQHDGSFRAFAKEGPDAVSQAF
ncbi:LOW QUALITY PROTEIN: Na(+)/H(+) exchange regulatory cofactor NHE-RF4 [Varanus komodoensis]|uniref:LOW QUALITY PROTEIN: Na(+)/H(+) exchange regulatory cofactor NHE-RF4 n=1 Tax=Varanus komodoensis TaxID=61221 RepID=UPI001CF7A7F4|nr:LOW QUALITY PROTEIN: Na(+)/H(+) exchange regulatory cofactor NHE-RF4 [Varanus komodoensis]